MEVSCLAAVGVKWPLPTRGEFDHALRACTHVRPWLGPGSGLGLGSRPRWHSSGTLVWCLGKDTGFVGFLGVCELHLFCSLFYLQFCLQLNCGRSEACEIKLGWWEGGLLRVPVVSWQRRRLRWILGCL
jgi:hypothetical protein